MLNKIKNKVGGFMKKIFKFDSAVGVFHGTLFLGAVAVASTQLLTAVFPVMYVYLSTALGGTVAYFLLLKKASKIDECHEKDHQ